MVRAQGEDFYEARLREGQGVFRAGRFSEAIDQFRIAAFGFLDRPALLSESLVRLALAQQAAKRESDLSATIQRFLEVERKFGAFSQAKLGPETRDFFRRLLEKRVPRSTLEVLPSFSVPPASGSDRKDRSPAPNPSPTQPARLLSGQP